MSRIQKTAFLSISQVVTTISTLAIAIVLSRVFVSYDEYGTYQQTILIFTFFSPLLALGLPAAAFYFLPRNKDSESSVCINGLFLILITSSIFIILCLTFGSSLIPQLFDNRDLKKTIPWLAIYGPATLILTYISSSLVAIDQARISAIFTILFRILLATLVIVGTIAITRASFSLCLQSVICLLGSIMGIMILFKSTKFNQPAGSMLSFSAMKRQLKYAVPLGLGATFDAMALSTDKVMVSSLLSTEEYAIFVNGAIEVPLIAAITVAAGAVILPDVVRAFKKEDLGLALQLWQLMVKRVSFFLLPAGFLFFLISNELIIILFSERFESSIETFRIYMLMLPAKVAYFGILFQGSAKTKLVLIRAIVTLFLNAILTYFLILKLGMAGAAWGTVAVVWLFVVPYCIKYSSKIVNTKWYLLIPFRYVFSIGLVSGLTAAISWKLSLFVNSSEPITMALCKGGIYMALILLLMLTFFRKDCIHIYKNFKLTTNYRN